MAKSKKTSKMPSAPSGPPRLGDWVNIIGIAGAGQISEILEQRSQARVQIKDQAFTVPLERLTFAEPPPTVQSSNLIRVQGHSAMQYEIDLHGMRVEDAMELVDRALDQAVVNHLEKFKVIHGHGTGALRKAVRELLGRHPHVENYRFGEPHEGGLACTIALLRQKRSGRGSS
jgi:DNA mismatch repair protein MutS2